MICGETEKINCRKEMGDKPDWRIKKKIRPLSLIGLFLLFLNHSDSKWLVSSFKSKTVNNTETTFEEPWRDLSPPSELCTPQRVRLASISDARLNSPVSWHIPGLLSWRIGDRAVLLTQKCHKLSDTCYGTITSSQAEAADWFQGGGRYVQRVSHSGQKHGNPFLWLQYKYACVRWDCVYVCYFGWCVWQELVFCIGQWMGCKLVHFLNYCTLSTTSTYMYFPWVFQFLCCFVHPLHYIWGPMSYIW